MVLNFHGKSSFQILIYIYILKSYFKCHFIVIILSFIYFIWYLKSQDQSLDHRCLHKSDAYTNEIKIYKCCNMYKSINLLTLSPITWYGIELSFTSLTCLPDSLTKWTKLLFKLKQSCHIGKICYFSLWEVGIAQMPCLLDRKICSNIFIKFLLRIPSLYLHIYSLKIICLN